MENPLVMENPLKTTRRLYGLTQTEVAELAGIGKNAVMRYEQGLYVEPSMKIINVLAAYGTPQSDLVEDYKDWRDYHQKSARRYINPLPNLEVKPNEHPFTTWRKTVTRRAVGKESAMSFCILLAVHNAVVLNYEKAGHKHIPNLLWNALANAGVSEPYLQNLDDLGAIYYERVHGSNVA